MGGSTSKTDIVRIKEQETRKRALVVTHTSDPLIQSRNKKDEVTFDRSSISLPLASRSLKDQHYSSSTSTSVVVAAKPIDQSEEISQRDVSRKSENFPQTSSAQKYSGETHESDEKDPRYEYLLKHGKKQFSSSSNNDEILFVELPEIPSIWIGYRKSPHRSKILCLDNLDLSHVPLLEGEEALRTISICGNNLTRVENFEGLPNLVEIDLTNNLITHIVDLTQVPLLGVLRLTSNRIQEITALESLSRLIFLDLSSNSIRAIQGLDKLASLKVLNLSENWITEITNLEGNPSLVELNLNKNAIARIGRGLHFQRDTLRILSIGFNLISQPQDIDSLKYMNALSDLVLEGNPISKQESKAQYQQIILEIGIKSLETVDFLQIHPRKKSERRSKSTNNNAIDVVLDDNQDQDYKQQQQQHLIYDEDYHTRRGRKSSPIGFLAQVNVNNQNMTIRSSSKPKQNTFERNVHAYSIGNENQQSDIPPTQSPSGNRKKIGNVHRDSLSRNSPLKTITESPTIVEKNEQIFHRDNPYSNRNISSRSKYQSHEFPQWRSILEKSEMLNNKDKKATLREYREVNFAGEIESTRQEKFLCVKATGNSAENVLTKSTYQLNTNYLDLSFTLFNLLVSETAQQGLRRFQRLYALSLRNLNLAELLPLSKLCLPLNLRSLRISNSPINACSYLREFVTYRFPQLTHFNDKEITTFDQQRAYSLFHKYDITLQLPSKLFSPEDVRNYPSVEKATQHIYPTRLYLQTVSEVAENFVGIVFEEVSDLDIPATKQVDSIISHLLQSTFD